MVVERTTDEIVVRLPSTLNVESIQRFLNYLLFKETVQKSLAIQEEIDELAREVNKSWWKKNKIKYLPEE